MGLGIRTTLQPIWLYRLAKLRFKLFQDASQHGESLVLQRRIGSDFPTFLVDVGANDGCLHSNSYFFIRRGWKGILIEPHPRVFQRLQTRYANAPGVVCENLACADKPDSLPLYFGADEAGEFSTLCTEDTEAFRVSRTADFARVEVKTLTEILQRHRCPRDFGILSVDTEGMDYEVLKGLDFSQFRPRLIVTEDYAKKDGDKFELLKANGYVLFKKRSVNSYWASVSE